MPLAPIVALLALQNGSIYHDGWIDFNKNGRKDIYEDSRATVEKRVDDLVSQMNLDEKTCQLATLYGYKRVLKDPFPTPGWKSELWKDGIANIDEQFNGFSYVTDEVYGRKPRTDYLWDAGLHAEALDRVQKWFVEETRLGIPVDFTDEGIRGVENTIATSFPAQIGMGSTWDPELVRKEGEITGREARLLGYTNVYAPILDVGRDPRWGRTEESYSEDPFLVASLGVEMVKGMQSQGTASTSKHFAVYGQNKGAREGYSRTDPQVSPFDVENIHLPPWRAACEAGLSGVMSSYNDYSGQTITGTPYWLTQRLRKDFGFQGYVVSDSDAVEYLYTKHHVASSPKEAVYQAVMAGLDVRTTFTPPGDYVLPLRELVREKRVPMSVIDARVRDVLRVKFRHLLFDNPLRANRDMARREVFSDENRAVACRAADEQLVLLKNEDGLLPLELKKFNRIAVIGPNADNPALARSHYGPLGVPVSTVFSSMKAMATSSSVEYAKGCDSKDPHWPDSEILPYPMDDKERAGFDEAVTLAKRSDLVVMVVGDMDWVTVGENKSRTALDLPGRQEQLLEAVHATGTPLVLVVIAGRPMTINWADKTVDAILWSWFPGAEGGDAIVDALAGKTNPGGHLSVTFPKSVGQLPLCFPTKPAANIETGKGNFGERQSSQGWAGVQGALYPFGFGLSYTTFKYQDLSVKLEDKGAWVLKFGVKNTGARSGDDVAQVYAHPIVTRVTRYEQELIAFRRIHLAPGETKVVEFKVPRTSFGYRDEKGRLVVDPGSFEVQVGRSSIDTPLKANVEIR